MCSMELTATSIYKKLSIQVDEISKAALSFRELEKKTILWTKGINLSSKLKIYYTTFDGVIASTY